MLKEHKHIMAVLIIAIQYFLNDFEFNEDDKLKLILSKP